MHLKSYVAVSAGTYVRGEINVRIKNCKISENEADKEESTTCGVRWGLCSVLPDVSK